MRPLSLRIAGFTCFRDKAEIDFRNLDIFAITGPTGAGKTTIVDAICYALYGRVPRHDGTTTLISHDRDSMSVDLEFEAGGGRYKVHRGINVMRKTGRDGREQVTRAVSPVQLEQFTDAGWSPIQGRVRAMDDEIAHIVGLDYRSFTVCVMLPQGRFQEFLAGEKRDRRQVLTDLLDIGVYQQMMTIANARAKDLSTRAEEMERRLREDYANATQEALEELRSELGDTRTRLEICKAQVEALTRAVAFAESVVTARKRQSDRVDRHKAVVVQIEEAEALAKDGQAKLEALSGELEGVLAHLAAVPYDRDRHFKLGRASDKVADLARLGPELAAVEKAATDDSAVEAARKVATQAEAALAKAEAATSTAEKDLASARRLDAAAHVRSGLKPGDHCPVCGGVISAEGPEAEPHLDEAEDRLSQLQAAGKAAGETASQATAAVQKELHRLESLERDLKRLRDSLAEAEAQLAATLPEGVASEAAAIEAAFAEQRRLEVEHRDLSSGADGLRGEIATLQPRVASSEQSLAGLRGQATQLEAEAQEADEEAEASKASLVGVAREWEWEAALSLIAQKQPPNQHLAAFLRTSQDEERSLTGRVATLERDERLIETNIEKAAKLVTERIDILAKADLYKELGRLLGAANFQTFVMEEAMQALAETATLHLAEIYPRFGLTVGDGEFKVIDHWQADQVRPATTLSGGETFAASLALALALSERVPELRSAASASLDSLFLDEGFGTLDSEALNEVIEALESLRSEERLVGIITHVPELARRIESRIEVEKSPEGSTLHFVGV